jgi:hypothetical protein
VPIPVVLQVVLVILILPAPFVLLVEEVAIHLALPLAVTTLVVLVEPTPLVTEVAQVVRVELLKVILQEVAAALLAIVVMAETVVLVPRLLDFKVMEAAVVVVTQAVVTLPQVQRLLVAE